MIPHQVLGQLNNIHQLLIGLLQDMPESEVNRRFHPDIPPMGWLLGRSVYLETHWLRERLSGDDDLTARVHHIFGSSGAPDPQADGLLPPKEHLLNWALEIMDEHLTRLANPGLLPDHPWLEDGWIARYLVQVHAQTYEQMVAVLAARSQGDSYPEYRVQTPLLAARPAADTVEVSQGHYRIGARDGVVFDNEQPMQMVELHNFRIARNPVSNAEYLAFMNDAGYANPAYWSEQGELWRTASAARHPVHWRQDAAGNWYAIGINGPADLLADDPVSGICQYEALAFVNWAASRFGELQGAILQHEYQWEAAARTQGLGNFGRVWEWCNNPFLPYADYQPPVDEEMRTREFDGAYYSRRGGCLHTQPSLRRVSYRQPALAHSRHHFSGARLVLPPSGQGDELYIAQWQKFLVED